MSFPGESPCRHRPGQGVLKRIRKGSTCFGSGDPSNMIWPSSSRKGLKGVGIKLIPRRFYDPALTRYCRHELMHINDMLDPAFGYDPDTRVG